MRTIAEIISTSFRKPISEEEARRRFRDFDELIPIAQVLYSTEEMHQLAILFNIHVICVDFTTIPLKDIYHFNYTEALLKKHLITESYINSTKYYSFTLLGAHYLCHLQKFHSS